MSVMKNHLMETAYEMAKMYDLPIFTMLEAYNHSNNETDALILALYCETKLLRAAIETDYDYDFLGKLFRDALEDGEDMKEAAEDIYNIAMEHDF